MSKQSASPPIYQIDKIGFPTPKTMFLKNGMQVFIIEGGSQEVCKIDFMFEAGRPHEHKRLTAATVAGIIKEGTIKSSASAIAEAVDHCGASISSPFSFDHIDLQLVCLSKHLTHLLPLLVEIVRKPLFDDAELTLFKKRTIQRLAVDLSHNDVVCYREATAQYFGKEHPYGYNSDESSYLAVTKEDLIHHHQRFFGPQNGKIFIAGKFTPDLLPALDMLLADWQPKTEKVTPLLPVLPSVRYHFRGDMGKPQSAIRIGRPLFNRNHPDWPAMFLLNTILGGYFGSRLMKNLREKRGLTYGVHSSVESLKYHGYLSISLETEKTNVKKVLKEIYREIDILRQETVPEAELQMVKNYTGGYLLSLMDGPLQILEVLKNNLSEDSPVDFTAQLLHRLAKITASEIRSTAQRYLRQDDLYEVVIH
jgi:predicted Zn-dependent peptidase